VPFLQVIRTIANRTGVSAVNAVDDTDTSPWMQSPAPGHAIADGDLLVELHLRIDGHRRRRRVP
jgi:hypothetical protein